METFHESEPLWSMIAAHSDTRLSFVSLSLPVYIYII